MAVLPDYHHPETIATVTDDGRVAIYGYADGKPAERRRLPWLTKARAATLFPAGRNLAVLRDDENGTTAPCTEPAI
jgi:hypothetical protein